MTQPNSTFLQFVSSEARTLLAPHLDTVALPQAMVLHDAGELIDTVYFPTAGVISLVAILLSGESIEIAMVGHDGVVGGASALGETRAACRAVVQIAGAALSMKSKTLREIARKDFDLQDSLFRYDQLIFLQTVQSTACISSHNVEARLARWLLRCRDLSGSKDLRLTQEFLADMLGVRRASVSVVAHTLQAAGFIKYSRGHIRITNADGLHEASCECYNSIREATQRAHR
jgi:CRP-like cAMP-binding protein